MKTTKLVCTEVLYREFPDLLFGALNETLYFDATNYIAKKGNSEKHKVSFFEMNFLLWKNVICKAYGLNPEDVIIKDLESQHILIHESLALLFVAYIDPDFMVYMLHAIESVFKDGIFISDTALSIMAKSRFPDYFKME